MSLSADWVLAERTCCLSPSYLVSSAFFRVQQQHHMLSAKHCKQIQKNSLSLTVHKSQICITKLSMFHVWPEIHLLVGLGMLSELLSVRLFDWCRDYLEDRPFLWGRCWLQHVEYMEALWGCVWGFGWVFFLFSFFPFCSQYSRLKEVSKDSSSADQQVDVLILSAISYSWLPATRSSDHDSC